MNVHKTRNLTMLATVTAMIIAVSMTVIADTNTTIISTSITNTTINRDHDHAASVTARPAKNQTENQYLPLIEQYRLAVNGDSDARDLAFSGFESAALQNPLDPLTIAYLGGLHTLIGRDAWMPWTKLNHTERGLDTMAKAMMMLRPEHDQLLVDGLPVSTEIKSISAITFTLVPFFFNRFDQGYELLLEIIESEQLAEIPFSRKAYLYYYAGLAAEKEDQHARASVFYQTLVDNLNQGEYVEKARLQLAQLSDY
ncbi:MAG: hypothetical protein COB51_02505 [Moraxellaceae bacterium]|nr:MAG: hypothetical protein COB51_02505 [Moraxellaceae bacterium]